MNNALKDTLTVMGGHLSNHTNFEFIYGYWFL